MSQERLYAIPKLETQSDSSLNLQNKKRHRKPFGGAKGGLAAAAVALSSLAFAHPSGQAENPQDYQEPPVTGSHPTETLTDSDLTTSNLLLYPPVADVASLETGFKDPDSGSNLGAAQQAETDLTLDSDADGCTDAEERSPVARIGGQRDPNNPWDFFDVTGDKKVDALDMQWVTFRYGATKGALLYAPQFDRSVIGPNNWNLGPGDGVINLVDAMAVVAQHGHQCGLLPQIAQEFAKREKKLTVDTTPPETSGVALWQLLCYPTHEAFLADWNDGNNQLNPPECSSGAGEAAGSNLSDIISRIDRSGPICIEDPEATPTPACSQPALIIITKAPSPYLRTATEDTNPYDCYTSFNAIWETNSDGDPTGLGDDGTHFLWVAGEQCPKNPLALGHSTYSQYYQWDTGTWRGAQPRGGTSSDLPNPYSVPGVKQWASHPVYVPPYLRINCRRLKVAHWVLYRVQDDPLLELRQWNSYSPQTVCF